MLGGKRGLYYWFVDEREGSVESTDSLDWCFKSEEALFLEVRREFGANTAGDRSLVTDDTSACFIDTLHKSFEVVWVDRLQINNFTAHTEFLFGEFRSL